MWRDVQTLIRIDMVLVRPPKGRKYRFQQLQPIYNLWLWQNFVQSFRRIHVEANGIWYFRCVRSHTQSHTHTLHLTSSSFLNSNPNLVAILETMMKSYARSFWKTRTPSSSVMSLQRIRIIGPSAIMSRQTTLKKIVKIYLFPQLFLGEAKNFLNYPRICKQAMWGRGKFHLTKEINQVEILRETGSRCSLAPVQRARSHCLDCKSRIN